MAEEYAGPAVICCGACGLFSFLILMLCSWQGLPATKYGIKRNVITGVVDLSGEVYYGGRNVIGFYNEFIEFPATLQTLEWLDDAWSDHSRWRDLQPMVVRTRDALEVRLGMTMQYLIMQEKIPLMYSVFEEGYELYFTSIMRSAFQLVASKFEFEELWTKRSEVRDAMFAECSRLSGIQISDGGMDGMIQCWGIQLLDIHIDQEIDDTIEARQVQTQQQHLEKEKQEYILVDAATEVMEAGYQKQTQVVNSNATAEAYKITSKATVDASHDMEAAHAEMLGVTSSKLGLGGAALTEFLEQGAILQNKHSDLVLGAFASTGMIMKTAAGGRRLEEQAAEESSGLRRLDASADARLAGPSAAQVPSAKTAQASPEALGSMIDPLLVEGHEL
eukprot:TRINITY_DN3506_c0_g1_i1.p1 TRINITY_DN3506_c0_g1~~TRINITY_DN3506_c0_g1_i1.p1  ORF type:complete len:390 (-),score=131.18 TRINITY_DN3506_c0_g1_i1:402-1571(-)